MSKALPRLAWMLLLLGGAVTWGVTTGALNPRITPDLDALPASLGDFRTLEVFSVDSGLLGDLPPDRFTFRRIGDDAGRAGLLYLAYFERGRRWSGRPHDVPVCYRAEGWEPLGERQLETPSGAHFGIQDFSRGEEQIRVCYWIQQPGLLPGHETPRAYLGRMFGKARLRQDMASVYFEFPMAANLSDPEAIRTAQDLMTAMDGLWIRP